LAKPQNKFFGDFPFKIKSVTFSRPQCRNFFVASEKFPAISNGYIRFKQSSGNEGGGQGKGRRATLPLPGIDGGR
jgi:hypothetical protein